MGVFGVNMPTLYGEENKAFYRLQEEILKTSTDPSLFAWGAPYDVNFWDSSPGYVMDHDHLNDYRHLFAPGPECFRDCQGTVGLDMVSIR